MITNYKHSKISREMNFLYLIDSSGFKIYEISNNNSMIGSCENENY